MFVQYLKVPKYIHIMCQKYIMFTYDERDLDEYLIEIVHNLEI